MGKIKIKRKKLSRQELEESFDFIAPATGLIVPLTHSDDSIIRRGELGIGFLLDNFQEDELISPIKGTYFSTLDMSTGIVLLSENKKVFTIIKLTGGNEFINNQGIEIIPQADSEIIIRGQRIIRIDRKYLELKQYNFQLTVTFLLNQTNEEVEKHDILYTFSSSDGRIKQNAILGTIYQVDPNKVRDI